MEFLRTYQLDIMMFMSGICGVLVILTLMTKTLSPKRRHFLACLEAGLCSCCFSTVVPISTGVTRVNQCQLVNIMG